MNYEFFITMTVIITYCSIYYDFVNIFLLIRWFKISFLFREWIAFHWFNIIKFIAGAPVEGAPPAEGKFRKNFFSIMSNFVNNHIQKSRVDSILYVKAERLLLWKRWYKVYYQPALHKSILNFRSSFILLIFDQVNF